ncbi:protein ACCUMULATION AND REPLICATION OF CHLOROPLASTS 3, chloroplastic isoform X2 [Ziziphus jujuba]|uniref:Protein ACCUMULATION AND REPLICATION OF CHLOROPLASTS 3, chloroplastic isoform X2 n=1 Tax=Ziziphus jujuba TaxID=326968 RepID=A0A6P4AY90_ZIZJJ|nr:protein ACCUMULATION AND REPLICATION OF CHLOROPLASTS 3, chloroplastic isoform X2 [Ziziphus jujuba]
MEIPVFTSFRLSYSSAVSLRSCSSKYSIFFHGCFFRGKRLSIRWNIYSSKPCMGIKASLENNSLSNGVLGKAKTEVNSGDFWGHSEFVEVIGIGSRRDAVLNFCLESQFKSSSLRFWNVLIKDSIAVQLQQRFLGKDLAPRIFEAPLSLKSSSKTIILVASAGYGLDHITIVDILKTLRSANGFSVVIILKPFSFEGQKRQDEIKNLVEKLRGHTNLFIDIDTDMLLKKDLVTLDEAVRTANNAVFLAMTAVSSLVSDIHHKLIDVSHNNVKEIGVSEVLNILERYKEAKIGFGAGYSIKTSILQSVYDCPFLGMGVKDLDGTIICVLASSGDISNSDMHTFVHTFRQTTEYTNEIVVSTFHEPSLEPNLLVTMVLVLGFTGQQTSQKSSIISRLAQRFPFIFGLLTRHHWQSTDTQGNNLPDNGCPEESVSQEPLETGDRAAVDVVAEDSDKYPEEEEEIQPVMSSNYNGSYASSGSDHETELFGATNEFSRLYDPGGEDTPAFQREPLVRWNLGPGYQIAQEWAKERAAKAGAGSVLDKLSIFCLPVGVRPSEELKDNVNVSSLTHRREPKAEDGLKEQTVGNFDTGLEVVKEFCNTASALLKGKYADPRRKQGHLSARAASMLEAERDSPKKWSPIVEIKYRGGIYRGRCQGGLPEGKGCLVLGDGSIYDGMWRYGKRSGLGTFYFSNGDVFQGSWRDDVMHGKGWFYFHTGDRWFANFWKGKANGEGRFYSKSGDVFFGQFQDGLRHGDFLCIDVDGTRCLENWDQGILVSRRPFDT